MGFHTFNGSCRKQHQSDVKMPAADLLWRLARSLLNTWYVLMRVPSTSLLHIVTMDGPTLAYVLENDAVSFGEHGRLFLQCSTTN